MFYIFDSNGYEQKTFSRYYISLNIFRETVNIEFFYSCKITLVHGCTARLWDKLKFQSHKYWKECRIRAVVSRKNLTFLSSKVQKSNN